ncbi:transmembrane protein 74 isoform X2 [Varanus komodoensis]|nr:transmembrane protein 74 isoform X2 [Varanus komodoensis]
MSAERSEWHCKAPQRPAKDDPAQASFSFPATPSWSPDHAAAGQVACHPTLPLEEKEAVMQKRACCCESDTSFTCVDENVNNLDHTGSLAHQGCCQDLDLLPHPEPCGERPLEWPYDPPSLVSEEDDDATSETAGKSVDYGFISAIFFLVSGILLVIVSYVVPRDVTVDPNTVAAREMERLENESAKVGAHLDRCVIAGLCLLTLGGVVLSSLLMISMWKGELYRRNRFAASTETAKLYGSFNFRVKSSPNDNMELSLVEEDVLAVDG